MLTIYSRKVELKKSVSTTVTIDEGRVAMGPSMGLLRSKPISQMVKLVTTVIIGAGNRGKNYAAFSKDEPDKFQVVGVAEPKKVRRDLMRDTYSLESQYVFSDWKDAAACHKFADCVVIATLDQQHQEPAVAFANKGYHILLEKPMAVTASDCQEIVKACKDNGVILAVGHVLRYGFHSRKVKELIDSGVIGDVVNIQHSESIGFWHFAHSYVRGNWRKEEETSFSLLAKCCHDLDLINHWVGRRCAKVSSFGNLMHFSKENKPEGASSRCLDCAVEQKCPYSAKRIYLTDGAEKGKFHWPVSVVSDVKDIESVTEALKTGPYGRCVYDCDNDVVSHQVVNMEFAGGATASHTMSAFTRDVGIRETKIHGTKGDIHSIYDGPVVVCDFLTEEKTTYPYQEDTHNLSMGGHGGCDYLLTAAFVKAVAEDDKSRIVSGPDETLASHLIVFAAEKARLENRVVMMEEFGI